MKRLLFGSGRRACRNLYLLVAFVFATLSGCNCFASRPCTECRPDGRCFTGCDSLLGCYETDLQADLQNCGSCDHECGSDEVCKGGVCKSCSPQLKCSSLDNRCTDPKTDSYYCGASDCSGSTGAHCGACACVNGSCAAPGPGQIMCPGLGCVDPNSEPTHCGASGDCTGANAGIACGHDQGCFQGSCECQSSAFTSCGSGCCEAGHCDAGYCPPGF